MNQVISQALYERATDIHFEPTEQAMLVRFRVDGLLYDSLTPPKALATGLLTRIKILANIDIAERRKPQDGRFSVKLKGRKSMSASRRSPFFTARKVVLRLLDKTRVQARPESLGFEARHARVVPPRDPSAVRDGDPFRARPAPANPPRCTRRSAS